MFPRTRRFRLIAIGLALAGLSAGCSGAGPTSSPAGGVWKGSTPADTLIGFTGASGDYQINFNPFSPTQVGGIGTIFESLFFFNQVKTAPVVPLLGTDYSWNADGTVLSITTRSGVTWSDGVPFTAADVAYTFGLIARTPTINSGGFTGEAVATDDTHVVITFKEPTFVDGPQFLGKTMILPAHIWKDIPDPDRNVIAKPVGTGPYTLSDFKNQAYTLAANPKYWAGEPAVKKIRFVSLSGNQGGADALAAGQIDFLTSPVPDLAHVPERYKGYQAITTPNTQITLVSCSNAALGCKGLQTDVAVRKAIYYAMDRTQINKLAFQDTGSEISSGMVLRPRDEAATSSKLSEPTAPMTAQVAKATSLLEGAGWAKGADGIYAKGGQRLALTVLVVSGWTDYITAVNTIKQQLKQAGIEITAQQVSWNEWSDARGRGQYQLLIDSVAGGATADPFYLFAYFFTSANTKPVGDKDAANPNWARFSDPEVDAAVEALRRIDPKNSAARQPYLDAIQTKVAESMPYIPILTGGITSVFNAAKFAGWPNRDGMYALPAIWASPDNAEIFKHLKPAGP